MLRNSRRSRRSFFYQLQTWAEFFVLSVVFIHMAATRGVGWWYNVAAGFESVGFALWWVPAYFYPYYLLLFCAGYVCS